jgi:hypothetical protein
MNLEEQVRKHKEISRKIEELEAEKKALGETILQTMSNKSMRLGSYVVKRCSRITISSTLDQARSFQAIRMEEVVDKEKLKELYRSGVEIPGVKTIEYVQISQNEILNV